MASSGSIAVWCKSCTSGDVSGFEAHFNYWRLVGDKGRWGGSRGKAADFIEVGILLAKPIQIEHVCVFLPLSISASDIEDCSRHLTNSHIAQGIFNEVLMSSDIPTHGPKYVSLRAKDSTVFCNVHAFTLADRGIVPGELSLERIDGGTLISVEHDAVESCCSSGQNARAYFRLRIYIRDQDKNPFVSVIPTGDHLLQSGYNEIEYLDFRVNDVRTLPDAIELRMRLDRKMSFVPLDLVAFLAAVPVKSELSMSNSPSHKIRLLEQGLWSLYVRGIPEDMMVYHWKKIAAPQSTSSAERPLTITPTSPNGVDDFTAFIKVQTRRTGRGIWGVYLLIFIGLSVVGNFVFAGINRVAFGPTPQCSCVCLLDCTRRDGFGG